MNSYRCFKRWFKSGLIFSVLLGLSACGSLNSSSGKFDPNNIPDAVPKAEPRSKSGNPNSYVIAGKRYYVLKDAKGYDKVGNASWYGSKFHGKLTSSDEPYNMYSMTAASTTLPIPTYVRVTNLRNGRTAIVKVNDRGPFRSNRIIDLSYAAATKLGYAAQGTTKVRVTALDPGSPTENMFFAQNNVSAPKNNTAQPAKLNGATKPVQLAQQDSIAKYLQVGAFHKRSTAESVSKQITRLTKLNQVKVAVKESVKDGARLYRVHIGPLQDSSQSEQMAQLLAKHGFGKSMVVTS